MERKQEAFSLACHNFSDIRRRPLVIGKLDQVRLPFVVTMPQLAVGAIVFGLLFLTRPGWGAVMSDRLHIVVFVAAPVLVAQQVSRTSIEGRPLSKATMGFLRLWLAPRHGAVNGRRLPAAGRETFTVLPLVEGEGDDAGSARRSPRRLRSRTAGARSGERRRGAT